VAEIEKIVWVGPARDELRELPEKARVRLARGLDRIQHGGEPGDWKSLPSIGPGVCEIRCRDDAGSYRCLYAVKGKPPVLYVLVAFTKKTQKTPSSVISLAKTRYSAVLGKKK